MKKTKKIIQGFTIVELIIVISIFAILVGTVFYNFGDFFSNQQLKTYGQDMVQSLRKAQSNATMRINDSQWGVGFVDTANQFIFFKGDNFAIRDSNYDEVHEFPDILSFENISLNGGGNTVIFSRVSGETTNYGSLDFQLDSTKKYTININQLGQIEIN
ncbi:prepilin-type N-terminal cleavage/methylation domain-containing protein [Patescibacteria group bacterium]|nr:prepilin-type N-terminal cleavage/methylation domain-containing protein [Patescibacteria group bacterium]